MADKKIFCFTHFDLDGAVSYLVTKWAHPGYKIECEPLSGTDNRYEIMQWLTKNDFSKYERVFFLDLDVSNSIDLIDHENVIIIDHHKTHAENKNYKKAVAIVKEYSSACLLAYRVFKKLYNSNFTEEQKKLVIFGNDYDSYELQFPESRNLNIVFWNTQKSFPSFIENFSNGFFTFTKEQEAICRIYENDLERQIKNLKVFRGIHADIDGEARVVVATFAEKNMNDVSDYLLKTYEADCSAIINTKTQRVHFRRPKNGTMKLDIFAKDMADGGGHEYSSGGVLTETFLRFTKLLKPV